jgi:hypothetical protein
LTKTSEGWQLVVDPEDGTPAEVFSGKTKNEVMKKLAESKANATRELRRRKNKKSVLKELSEITPEANPPVRRFEEKRLTADEQYEIANGLNTPESTLKSFDKLIEARFGASPDEIRATLNLTHEQKAFDRDRSTAVQWVSENPEFYNCPENIESMKNFLVTRNWDVTKKNLSDAYRFLSAQGELLEREDDEVPPAAVAVPVVVPASVVPAAVVPAPVATPVTPPVSSAPTPSALPARAVVRPGSNSTAIPRSATTVVAPGSGPVGLTAEEYYKIPAAAMKIRMQRDPAFRAQVDRLVAEGKI